MTNREITLEEVIKQRVLTEYLERIQAKGTTLNTDPFQFESRLFDEVYLLVARQHGLRYYRSSPLLSANEAAARIYWINYKNAARQRIRSALARLRRNVVKKEPVTAKAVQSIQPREPPQATASGQYLLPGFVAPMPKKVRRRILRILAESKHP